MKSKFFWLRQSAALLITLLFLSSVATASAGLLLKHTAGRASPTVQKTMAIAVPFLFLRGEVSREELSPPKTISPVEREISKGAPAAPLGPQGEQGRDSSHSEAVPYRHVGEDYFDTALFVGDSRTEGMKLYGRLGQADYFASAGMSVFNLFDKKASDKNFGEQSLYSLLGAKQYETIYLSLGINEVGYPVATLREKFDFVVAELRRLQPDARLILLGNLVVTREKAEASASLSLENIRALNEHIASYADNETSFYLDPNALFAGEDGYLRSEMTGDGVHPYAKEYRNLAIWLKDYGI